MLHKKPKMEFLYLSLMVFIPKVTTNPKNFDGFANCVMKPGSTLAKVAILSRFKAL